MLSPFELIEPSFARNEVYSSEMTDDQLKKVLEKLVAEIPLRVAEGVSASRSNTPPPNPLRIDTWQKRVGLVLGLLTIIGILWQ